ncbi:3-hydroxybutyryl-CoA dehydrogenase [Desulfoscipio geothermicus]|uniref:3-hydroxybutyryl-CoA dehydrogenase n=1 Tax=Desulfoscipio geothermicus DSM 3669 TaxID=1121426 RepID=A0A1I6CQM6_9FIRM|nr:3-hydroxybutyryl-CoA dehydrogenase [Desulfoscipio geothermicus]SFQ95501.1 3-hydroxybutyryl-CoA dehydrogenase [Desulfoscipio geothermicus DSM 3669]
MNIQKVFVVGAGQMGSGIAQVAAATGYSVKLNDLHDDLVNKGLKVIEKNLDRNLSKGRISEEEKQKIFSRLQKSTSLKDAHDADIVIEAAVENITIKTGIFKELDHICPTQTILATNTSSLPITEIAAATQRPDKVVGMHFMNPVPVIKLVEIIRGLATSSDTFNIVKEMSEQMGKIPVEVNDAPGFVSNRVLCPMINEAIYTVYEGIATPEAVDQVMKLGMNHPMGPLELADLIGLDTVLYIMEILHQGFGDSKYRPCPLLRKYVAAGWLGRKSGKGFYNYS